MPNQLRDVPVGIRALQKITDSCFPGAIFNRERWYRLSVLILTYIAYMCYHMSRKPISVVKAVLHYNCSNLTPPSNVPPDDITTWCDWAPFDGTDAHASRLLGELDSAFLFAYAAAMFVSGFVAERVNLRYFLSLGMLMSGIFCYMFGLAKTYNVHNLTYFIAVQAAAGIFQTTGWPGVVTVVGNWCGKNKRGLTFGIWNSHTSIGNILGSLIAGAYVETDWSLSFIIPGFLIGMAGFIMFLFLVVHPTDVACMPPDSSKKHDRSLHDAVENCESGQNDDRTEVLIREQERMENPLIRSSSGYEVHRRATEWTHLLENSRPHRRDKAIGFLGACRIPGVIEFALSLFFSKLVSYTFLFWLPLYVNASTTLGATYSADISTLFDVGGIAGAIAAGAISDYTGMSACTCSIMLIFSIPMMYIYQLFGSTTLGINMILLIVVGLLVNGPYALITTAVSAELGTHSCLEGNSKALATVTAIIDGTGSIGAAVGPLVAGFVSSYGWQNVFYVLMGSNVCALILLLRLVKHELLRWRTSRRSSRTERP